ncbi:uncharacterized protein N7529_002102 [Penicillium soppii]|uniref:uncharacterized protein n=1 Tax=Penicillium soppii TaxID=69789 RepID=UPI002549AFE2|nr:uncharacterized protein N7529_002102 [Penicillium soppii]KAJ5876518.1 hypothetical protein N7529_002102 [Penicillium soppii]
MKRELHTRQQKEKLLKRLGSPITIQETRKSLDVVARSSFIAIYAEKDLTCVTHTAGSAPKLPSKEGGL